ncbi:hypothetical protein JMJ35_006234 [Cladonia borealis]|uniref:Rhodopsin domain-containing protein n=1 Tax=Cladonia borealis TaxID=184061 RepID=A0AA39U9S6_9LECA|nr:hypothetical protein JMJ35_006234 [Cladonia borealis]
MGITNIVAALHGDLEGEVPMNEQSGSGSNHSTTVFLQTRWALQLQSTLALTFTRLSILLFYRRIFSNHNPIFRALTSNLIGIIIAWGISFFLATLFQCYPIHLIWAPPYAQSSHCYNSHPMLLAATISNTIINISLLALPQPMLPKLHIPPLQKLAAGGIFALGTLVCAISIIRMTLSIRASSTSNITYTKPSPTFTWTYLESALALLTANLPTLLPLLPFLSNPTTQNTPFHPATPSKMPLRRHISHDSDLSRLTKHRDDAILSTTVQGMQFANNPRMDLDFEMGGQEMLGPGRIMVEKHMSCHSEAVESP